MRETACVSHSARLMPRLRQCHHFDIGNTLRPQVDSAFATKGRLGGTGRDEAFTRAFGDAITSTSANRSGAPAARSIEGIDLDGIAVGIDGGDVTGGGVSTVYDPERDEILREGMVTAAELRRVLLT